MAVEWIPLGSDLMKEARDRLGLGTEAVARRMSERGYKIDSGKTVERWEKRGEVPRPALPSYAKVLEIEVEKPEPLKVKLSPRPEEAYGVIAQAAQDVALALEELRTLLIQQSELVAEMRSFVAAMQRYGDSSR